MERPERGPTGSAFRTGGKGREGSVFSSLAQRGQVLSDRHGSPNCKRKGLGTAGNAGSRDVIIWESADLVHWSSPWAVTLGVPGAGCVWAPEAIYDEASDDFLVFWASATQEPHEKERKQKIYSARTKDFRSFTASEKYIERENHIIDTTIIAHNGTYYRFSKDETTKNIRVEKGTSLDKDSFTNLSAPALEELFGVEGPQIFKLGDREEWCLIVDRFAEGKGYSPC